MRRKRNGSRPRPQPEPPPFDTGDPLAGIQQYVWPQRDKPARREP